MEGLLIKRIQLLNIFRIGGFSNAPERPGNHLSVLGGAPVKETNPFFPMKMVDIPSSSQSQGNKKME